MKDSTVEPRFTNLIRSWRPFVARNVRKQKLLWSHGVLFNNIQKNHARQIRAGMCTERKLHSNCRFPADTPSLSPTVVAGLRVRYSRLFFFVKFVREPINYITNAHTRFGVSAPSSGCFDLRLLQL
jgi:hypothetical protein